VDAGHVAAHRGSVKAIRPDRRARTVVLVALLLLAASVRIWGLRFGLPNTACRPDESVIVELASRFWTGDLNPHFFRYPTLHLYLTSLAFGADYVQGRMLGTYASLEAFRARMFLDPAHFHSIARALVALFGTATVLVLYRLASAALGHATGLVAAFFLSLTYLHARDSHFGTTDMTLALLLTLATLFVWRCYIRGRPSDYVYAGLAAGLAASTKYVGVLVALPLLFAHLARPRATMEHAATPSELRKVIFFGLCLCLGFLGGTPFALSEWRQLAHDVSTEWGYAAAGYWAVFGRGWSFHPTFSLWYGMGFTQLIAAVAGIIFLVVRRPRAAGVLFGFPLAYCALIARDRTVFVRYVIPLLPFLCLAAAYAVTTIAGRVSRGSTPRRARAVVALLALVTIAPSLVTLVQFDRLLTRIDTRLLTRTWIDEHIAPGDSIYRSGASWGTVQLAPSEGAIVRQQDGPRRAEARRFLLGRREQSGIVGYDDWSMDGATFKVNGRPTSAEPHFILVQESPLVVYSALSDELRTLLAARYVVRQEFRYNTWDERQRFDQQDAFYVPFVGFDGMSRPGPNFILYERNAPS
jgi:4-amino-4-deoxy-L-arabinose transferase-like glycosyltransferase